MKSNADEMTGNEHVADSGVTPKQLAVFLAVCRLGSLQAAAEASGVARQAVSRMIGQLEELLGARLFERVARGVRPTEFGTMLVPHAERMMRELEAVVRMRRLGRLPRRPLVVCALERVLERLGARFVLDFARREPAVTLSVVECSDDDALEALAAHRCELALVTGPFDERRFRATPLLRTRFVVRMREGHPLAACGVVRPADLADFPLVGRGRSCRCFREGLGVMLQEGGAADILVETASEPVETGILLETDAVAAGLDCCAAGEAEGIVVRPFEPSPGDAGRILAIVENRTGLPTKAAESFRNALLDWAAAAGVETCGCGGECRCGCNCSRCAGHAAPEEAHPPLRKKSAGCRCGGCG